MRISGLVTAVKGFTHMDQGGSAEPVDLAQSLSNTVTVLKSKARSKGVAVTLEFEPDLPRACGFVGELNQIWANLIDNALDAVAQNGHVAVWAGRERHFVVVRVTDDGPGISPDVKERMFDPFFTTKGVGKGTGLGLDIVRRLIGRNNGLIDVESQPGHTRFTISLPIAEGNAGGVRS
jgi:signal transduction histidine kinase